MFLLHLFILVITLKTHAITPNDSCTTKQSSTRMSSALERFKHFFELVGCQKNCKNWVLGKNGAMLAKNGAILGKNGAFQPLKIYTRLEKSGKTSNQGDQTLRKLFRMMFFLSCG